VLAALFLAASTAAASSHDPIVSRERDDHAFPLVSEGHAATLVVEAGDHPGVRHAADDLQADVERVAGVVPELSGSPDTEGPRVLIGTLGRSPMVDALVESGRLEAAGIAGRWEAFVVRQLGPDLVIAGSDPRGTIYGVYELSEQIGVSPWYWWADVPVEPAKELYVAALPGIVDDGPGVQYRGIFINDEAPSLTGWVHERFGAFDHTFYVHVFELLLRLRGNYLWPAMWQPRAFSADDPLNPKLADEYGVVIGTTHHEPMMRYHDEWSREERGPWDYSRNPERLREFWRGGVERAKPYESIYSLGMRGDGDSAMSPETNTALLERIVADQREILTEVLDRPVTEVPQLWALYKEVQDYYEAGMRVPDDVILLWCDDNWGNIRRLPTPDEMGRSGGAGVYYHFDYVGGPRNYKWINVQPISKVWEQMHLAWKHQANRIWIVNVGDIKPMEFPIEFFLTMAWDPEAMTIDAMQGHTARWAAREFGSGHAEEIAALIDGYTRLNRQRTPEMMSPDVYSLVSYDEADRHLADWHDLVSRAEAVEQALPKQARAAFFQLVLYPVKASAAVREVHIASGRNRLYAAQGRVSANRWAEHARAMFALDAALAGRYHSLRDEKWSHIMDEINFGYTYWQTPPAEVMPPLQILRPNPGPRPGLAVDGTPVAHPRWGTPPPRTPSIDVFSGSTRWVEVFNRGDESFGFDVEADEPWLRVSPASGTVDETTRLEVGAEWSEVPLDVEDASFTIRTDAGASFRVTVPVVNPSDLRPGDFDGHVEIDGHVAIEAPHTSRRIGADSVRWETLAGYGRTLGGVTSFPVREPAEEPRGESSRLEYDFFARTTGDVDLEIHTAPSLDYEGGEGLRFAVSIDDGVPQVLKLDTWKTLQTWEKAVGDGVTRVRTRVTLDEPGRHTLKIWRVTPGVVFERFVLGNPATWQNGGQGVLPSYLGPPESPHRTTVAE